MTVLTKRAVEVFAPTTAGGQLRGADMAESMVWGTELERSIEGAAVGRIDQATWAGLAAIAGTRPGQPAIVFGPDAGTHIDPVTGLPVQNVGEYYWSASPAGWRRAGNLQRTLVHALNTGAGTGNAVQAISDVQFSQSEYAALITVNFVGANTGPMTLSINGEVPRPLVTNTGDAIPAGYVTADMAAMVQIDADGNYRLFSYGDASAIQAAAEAAQAAAEAAAIMAAESAGANVTAETAAALATAVVPPALQYIRTSSHNLLSKLGAALYKKVDTEPAHNLWEPRDGGGFWELSSARVDATMAGMVGDNSYGNGQALSDALGYAEMFGAELYLPRGRYKVSASTVVNSPDKPPSIIGDGSNASIIEAAPGSYYVLEFGNVEGLHLQGFRIRKPVGSEDYAGGGIYLHESHYGYVKDVLTWGFDVGLDMLNVLSTRFDRYMALYNKVGVRGAENGAAATGVISPPNALTFVAPILGLNTEMGADFTGPMALKFIGGSIEGNGTTVGTVGHGGIRLTNAMAMALDLDTVQMERNKGAADLYIVAIAAGSADAVYNVHGCPIFPIDNSSYVTNRIYLENAQPQRLNLTGNSFKHFGTYTPNASRKAIAAANPGLVDINLMGDIGQFYSDTEFPTGFGAMGMRYGLRVNADGSPAKLPRRSAGWGTSLDSTGTYTITLPSYLNAQDFAWTATTNTGDVGMFAERTFVGTSTVTVITRNVSSALANAAFSLTATPI